MNECLTIVLFHFSSVKRYFSETFYFTHVRELVKFKSHSTDYTDERNVEMKWQMETKTFLQNEREDILNPCLWLSTV